MMVVAGGLGLTDDYNLNSTEILIGGKWQKGERPFFLPTFK